MASVADPLREYTDWLQERAIIEDDYRMVLDGIADQIDADHDRRMGQCRRDTKRAALRYLRSVMEDYFRHDVKRRRNV